MKKYRLLKDLPFAKVGAKVEIEGEMIYVCRNDGLVYDIGREHELAQLISEGWIEEVKPREWTVVVNKFNDVIGYGNADKRVTKQYRLQNHGDRLDDFEIVHVQEID